MKKLNFLLLLLLSFSLCEAQGSFKTSGYLEKETLRREYFKTLKEYKGKYFVAEKRSIATISRGDRVLCIRSIDKKTLKSSKEQIYKNICIAKRRDEYNFLNIWQTNDKIYVLAMDNKTHDVVVMTIDVNTLVLSKKRKVLFSINDDYQKKPDVQKVFDRKKMYYETEVVTSENGKYTYAMVYLNEKGKPTKLMSYLINTNGIVTGSPVLPTPPDYQLNKEDVVLNVLDNGRAVVVIHPINGYEYGNMESGTTVYIISKEGQVISQKHVLIQAVSPNGEPVIAIRACFMTDKENLYIAGYAYGGFGTVSGRLSIDNRSDTCRLAFHPFNKQVLTEFWSTSDKKMEKVESDIDEGKFDGISRDTRPTSLTITENGDLILVGCKNHVQHLYTPGSTDQTEIYHFGTVLVHRINPGNDVQYTKVIRMAQSTEATYNFPLFMHKAFEVNGDIALFLNDYYSYIDGYQMQGEYMKGHRGAIVIIAKDGSTWRKEPYYLTNTVDECLVVPTAGVVEEDGSILVPVKPWPMINLGYARFQPNK